MKMSNNLLQRLLICAGSAVVALALTGCVARQEAPTYTFGQTAHPGNPYERAETIGHVPAVVEVPSQPVSSQTTPNTLDMRTELVRIQKRAPAAASVGQTIENEIVLTPLTHIGNVVLTHYLSANSTYVRSEPPAAVSGKQLVWTYDQLKQGDVQTIKVWLKPTAEGDMTSCSTISALPYGCVTTIVGRPALTIEKTGPATAQVGESVTYSIVVRNTGTSLAQKVEVTDKVPSGFTHESGRQELVFEAGDLKPGEAKQASVTLQAQQRGSFTNVAVANSANAGSVTANAVTLVVMPGLKVVKTGPPQQFLGKNANYKITVSNIGDTTLNNVRVTDQAPANAAIADAPGALVSGSQATWTVGSLDAGKSQSFDIALRASAAGVTVNRAVATADGGLNDSSEAETLWRGFAAVLVEMVDDPDPLLIGETTTYTLRVTNQGTAPDKNIKVVIKFPSQIIPVSVGGITEGVIQGNQVNFSVLPSIGPKQVATWTVRAKATVVGDARIQAEVTTELLKSQPVTEVEATQVY